MFLAQQLNEYHLKRSNDADGGIPGSLNSNGTKICVRIFLLHSKATTIFN